MIARRRFVGAVGALLVIAPLSLRAQAPAKIWRIGFLNAGSRQLMIESGALPAFLAGMRELGYVEGKNLAIEWRFADGNDDRLPGFAAELVGLKIDLIVAAPSPAIRAAQQATSRIPIVFPTTGDPVGSGFAASLARPGGNLTGLSNSNLDVSAKTLELLALAVPKLSRVAVLADPRSSTERAMLKRIDAAARVIGIQTFVIEVRAPEDLEAAFARMVRERADALIIAQGGVMFSLNRRLIADLAISHRLPSISQGAFNARAGWLMSYGVGTSAENYRRAASYVDKILRGAKPGDLPIEQPTRFVLVIDLNTAKALGLTIPQALLLRADEVIQ